MAANEIPAVPVVTVVARTDVEPLIPLLLDAEPSRSALEWSLDNLSDTIYRLDVGGELVGAATVRWRYDPAEIVEIAIAPERQGQGLGKFLVG